MELVEEANIDKEIEESEGFNGELYLYLLKLDSLSKELKKPSKPSQPSPVSASPQATGSTSHSTKFSKLILKKVSGNPKMWQEWWDVEKCNHSRSLVEDTAYATIAGLSLKEENYKTAIDLLQERIAQKQIMINSQ